MRRLVQVLVASVLAATPTPVPASLQVTDTTVVAGTSVRISGSGYNCQRVSVTLEGGGELGEISGGTFTDEDLPIPPNAVPGEHELEASCVDGVEYQTAMITIEPRPTNQQRIVLSPASADLGEVVTVDGTGFDACIDFKGSTISALTPVAVAVTLDDAPVATATVAESGAERGRFHTTFAIDPRVAPGDHPVTATCHNRFLPGTTTAFATLTVGDVTGPSPTAVTPGGGGEGSGGSGGSGGSVPRGPGGDPPAGSGSGIALVGIVAAVAAIGFVALRRRMRPAAPAPMPRRPPDVVVRAAGLGSAPARVTPGSGRDVSVRVVAHSGGVR